jgi:hypothetical protein
MWLLIMESVSVCYRLPGLSLKNILMVVADVNCSQVTSYCFWRTSLKAGINAESVRKVL